ncbi:MAG: molybdenum cofactor biosynthesis protein MoaE [Bacteroidetes bacterium]|nr:MAG: molybdenum cofactor biosynthesis protein MoaE [Bacteroidota bacterium]
MKDRKVKSIFKQGPIAPEFIAESLKKHQTKTKIGAHAMFMGQIREDETEKGKVCSMVYTAYEEMANELMHEIREEVFERFDLHCMHVYHSLGEVQTGELCLFVFVSSGHRKASFEACEYLVEEIKRKLPIFGKEIYENQEHAWKRNQFPENTME